MIELTESALILIKQWYGDSFVHQFRSDIQAARTIETVRRFLKYLSICS